MPTETSAAGMSPRHRPIAVLAAALLLAAATLTTLTASASAQPESTPSSSQRPGTATQPDVEACDSRAGIGVLFLYDTSASLRRTDPHAERRDGGLAALGDLRRLSVDYPQTAISVAIDGFADEYQPGSWVRLDPESDEPPAVLTGQIRTVGARDNGQRTDYRAALRGAASTLRSLSTEQCTRVIWFTDGSHDTDGRSQFTDSESAQIGAMCAEDGETHHLNRLGVHVTAVQLSPSPGSGTTESLLRLFGLSSQPCAYPLNGEIVDAPDVTRLNGILRRNAENAGWEAIEHPPEALRCIPEGVDRCEFAFDVGAEASFDVYLDLSAATDGRYPELRIMTPAGNDSGVLSFDRAPLLDPATGLLIWAPTQTWRQIRGHIAAEHSPHRTGEWAWEGEWRIVASGANAGVMLATPPRVARGATPTLTATGESNGDRVTGTVTGIGDGEALVRITLADDDTVTILDTDVPVAADGTWAADGLHSRVSEALLEDGRSFFDAVPVRVKLAQSFQWGDSELVWQPPWAQQIVMVIPPTANGGDGRFCRALDGATEIACAWSFRLADSAETFSVLIGRVNAVASDTIRAALVTPSGERLPVDVTAQSGQMPVARNRETGTGLVYVHRAVQASTVSDALWAGDWQIEFAGRYDIVGEMPTPEVQVQHSPSVTARFDSGTGALRGVVSRPGGQIGDPPRGSVKLYLELPGSGFHGLLIGPAGGYEIVDGRWAAEQPVDAVMDVTGIRAVLRETGGALDIRAVYLGETAWGTGEQPSTVIWEAPEVHAVASLRIPASFGWGAEFVHPWVHAVDEAEPPPDGGHLLAVTVRPGMEDGRLVLEEATARDSEGTPHALTSVGWSCDVPSSDGPLFECPPLVLSYPAGGSLAAGEGRIDADFVSSLDDEADLMDVAAERDLADQASHLYRPILQPIQVPVSIPGGGRGLLAALGAVLLITAVAAVVLLIRRRRAGSIP